MLVVILVCEHAVLKQRVFYSVQAWYCMSPSVKAEYEVFRYYSKNGYYLSVTSPEPYGTVSV